MSVKEASCPGCGATLTFRSAATLLIVCEYCDSASWRRDVNLELLGKVAHVADIDSVLALGARGTREGQAWTAVGLVQLDHGAGPWNEWALALDDGTTAWLAEAQGELLLSREVPVGAGPRWGDLSPGSKVTFDERLWVVAEVGEGRVTAARGELPADLRPGAVYSYADLRGPGGRFATLNYVEGAEEPALAFAGRTVTADLLGIEPDSVPHREPRRVEPRRIACASCGQSFDVRHPDESRRATCPSCRALLDVSSPEAVVLKEQKRREEIPRLPLGAQVTLRGLKVEVLAMLVRSVRVEGVRYPWSEYLLRVEGGGYRWLVEAKGHWSLVEPAPLGDVVRGARRLSLAGRDFQHFQSGEAQVDLVLGEVTWAVAVGEKADTEDWIDPPEMLTLETTASERVASLGHYLPREEVYAAFGPQVTLPAPEGVAPHQPNRAAAARRGWWRLSLTAAAAAVLLWIAFETTHQDRVVWSGALAWQPPAAASPAAVRPTPPPPTGAGPAPPPTPEAPPEPNVHFSEPFEVSAARGNLRVRLHAPQLEGAWLGVDGALVNEDTGEVSYFAVAAEHWSGVEGGEAWSEGDREAKAWIGQLPAGRYALRLEADLEPARPRPEPFTLEVTSQVASTGRALLLVLLLLLPALCVSVAAWTFERRRWSESDHA